MGHAGAWPAPGENLAEVKARLLEDAGAVMVDHPAKFGNVMKGLLAESGRNGKIVRLQMKENSRIQNILTGHRSNLQHPAQPVNAAGTTPPTVHTCPQPLNPLPLASLRDAVSISTHPKLHLSSLNMALRPPASRILMKTLAT